MCVHEGCRNETGLGKLDQVVPMYLGSPRPRVGGMRAKVRNLRETHAQILMSVNSASVRRLVTCKSPTRKKLPCKWRGNLDDPG